MLSDREKVIAEIWARDTNPDLYAEIPESKEAQEVRRRYNWCDQLNDLARIYMHPDMQLPYGVGNRSVSATEHDYLQRNGGCEANGYVDEEATKKNLARMLRALKSLGAKIEKEYSDSTFSIKATFGSGLEFNVTTSRSAICEKKVVDRVWVEPSKGHFREVVEWECEPVALMDI